MSSKNEYVGANIKRIRNERNLTQQDVADRVGVTKQTICKIEKLGATNLQTLTRIADALHVDVNEFYKQSNERSIESGYPDFFTDEDVKLLIFECKPVMKKFNDTVAENIQKKIKEISREYTTNRSRIQSVLETYRIQSETYTHEQLIRACGYLSTQIFSDIYGIFLNAE